MGSDSKIPFSEPTASPQRSAAEESHRPRPPGLGTCFVPLSEEGSGAPLFLMHPRDGRPWSFQALVTSARWTRPIYAAHEPDLNWTHEVLSLSQLAQLYAADIRKIQPRGPYTLGGYSLGGALAFEAARHLYRDGQCVQHIVMFGTRQPVTRRVAVQSAGRTLLRRAACRAYEGGWIGDAALRRCGLASGRARFTACIGPRAGSVAELRRMLRVVCPEAIRRTRLEELNWKELCEFACDVLKTPSSPLPWKTVVAIAQSEEPLQVIRGLKISWKNLWYGSRFRTTWVYPGRITVYTGERDRHGVTGWQRYCSQTLDVRQLHVECADPTQEHACLLDPPNARRIASDLIARLDGQRGPHQKAPT